VLNPAFASITGRDFEVIELGWRADTSGGTPPNAPAELTAAALSRRRVRLDWSDESEDESSFLIEMRRGNAPFDLVRTVGADSTRIEIGGLRPGSRYAFRVKARNGAGDSGYSNRAVARTPD
jgi:titin